jgi:hypothetical protein
MLVDGALGESIGELAPEAGVVAVVVLVVDEDEDEDEEDWVLVVILVNGGSLP